MPDVTITEARKNVGSDGQREFGNDARHEPRRSLDDIFMSGPFIWIGRHPISCKYDLAGGVKNLYVERLTVQDLELNQMHVLRMPVTGGVDHTPDFDRALLWCFSRLVVPAEVVEQADNRVSAICVLFGENEVGRPYRLIRIQECEWNQRRGQRAVIGSAQRLVHPKLHDYRWHHIAAAIKRSGGIVRDHEIFTLLTAEIDDNVKSFRRRNGDVSQCNRGGEQTAVRADLVEGRSRSVQQSSVQCALYKLHVIEASV